MNEQQRFLLISNKKSIGDDLRPEDIFSYLQSKFILNFDEVELIKTEKTSRRKTQKLLSIIPDKGSTAFVHFHGALVDAGYEGLAELLISGLPHEEVGDGIMEEDDAPTVETILRDGGVPKRPVVHAKRPEELEKLRNALATLEKSDGWVLLHGMAGSGKTILAADVLEDKELLNTCFPGGVFWVSLGILDAARLLMKMQNLCAWLDSEQIYPAPRNVDEARDRLRILFAHEHPRSLLVLDDLWTKDDARYFDVRVRTFATSRNDFVTDNIAGHVVKVHIEDALTDDQSKTILAQWTHQNTSSLPKEAVGLIKQCQGSPLAISMIGALLRGHSNRWEYYLKQLQDGNVSRLKSKLAYDYPTLCEAISISVSNLPQEFREKYVYFAVFDEDSRIPASVLGLLWDADDVDVEDTMDELISRSLAKRYPPSKDQSYDTYGVHDLQVDYLKESQIATNGKSALKDLHKTLVEKYAARFHDDFAAVANDGYIYWNIINHLIEAEMIDKAVELLLSFQWIEAKLKATGAPDLINNYHKVMGLVRDVTKSQLKEFVHFIGINSYLLSTPGQQEYDLIQLALAQPFATGVHKTAKDLVKSGAKNDQFYVGWCNKPEGSSETCLLTVKHHQGPVYCCHWSQDGSDRIVSCGGDFNVKIWNACTGQTLFTLSGHTDTVHCCQFSPDATKVVSSSVDKTIKVWSVETGMPILTLKGHTSDVNCCTFSLTENGLVATCSSDATIKLWDVNDGILLRTLFGHTDAVNWCCFSPDGKRIASASNDHTLKIWNVTNGSSLVSCCSDNDFVSYCVYHPSGKRIMATSQNYLQLIDAENGQLLKSIQTNISVLSIAFSPDGKYAVGTHADSTAQLWNLEGGSCVGVFRGHSGWLHSVCYSKDGERIVTASADETCKIWKVEPVEEHAVKLRKVFDAKFEMEGGPIIVVANNNHEIQVIDGSNGNYLRKTGCLGSKITACRLSVDGKMVIAGLKTGHVKLMDSDTCSEIFSFVGHFGAISDCAVTSDGISIITASEDKTIKIWDLKSQKLKVECDGHTGIVTKTALFNSSMHFVSASYDGSVKVWNITNGDCLFTCNHNNNDTVLSCAASPDDQMIISTSAGSTAKLWSAVTGELLHTLKGHTDCVRCSAFSPDCSLVATGSDDSSVKLWDTKTGKNIATCEGHKVWVTDVHFASDGKTFVSISSDIKWWRRDGTPLQTFLVRGNYLRQIITSNNFDRFITIDDTGHLYILNAIK